MFSVEKAPIFENDREAVSKRAAHQMAELYKQLTRRPQSTRLSREDAQRLTLQLVIAMFAEDIDLLPASTITTIVRDCLDNGQSSHDLLNGLFRQMNNPTPAKHGRYAGVPGLARHKQGRQQLLDQGRSRMAAPRRQGAFVDPLRHPDERPDCSSAAASPTVNAKSGRCGGCKSIATRKIV